MRTGFRKRTRKERLEILAADGTQLNPLQAALAWRRLLGRMLELSDPTLPTTPKFEDLMHAIIAGIVHGRRLPAGKECQCTLTSGGLCLNCGRRVWQTETRPCSGCEHHQRLVDGSICNKHLMAITPDLLVTFRVNQGTCWTPKS